jgi:hypothetical protein
VGGRGRGCEEEEGGGERNDPNTLYAHMNKRNFFKNVSNEFFI